MNTEHKILSLLFILSLTLAALTSCGGNEAYDLLRGGIDRIKADGRADLDIELTAKISDSLSTEQLQLNASSWVEATDGGIISSGQFSTGTQGISVSFPYYMQDATVYTAVFGKLKSVPLTSLFAADDDSPNEITDDAAAIPEATRRLIWSKLNERIDFEARVDKLIKEHLRGVAIMSVEDGSSISCVITDSEIKSALADIASAAISALPKILNEIDISAPLRDSLKSSIQTWRTSSNDLAGIVFDDMTLTAAFDSDGGITDISLAFGWYTNGQVDGVGIELTLKFYPISENFEIVPPDDLTQFTPSQSLLG